jgi:hypothetical protein
VFNGLPNSLRMTYNAKTGLVLRVALSLVDPDKYNCGILRNIVGGRYEVAACDGD